MTRLIDADALDRAMYHKSFEVDDGRNVWNSGLWIRYKIYEEASREAPTIDAVPVEWIENYLRNYRYMAPIEKNFVREMIKAWAERKEE